MAVRAFNASEPLMQITTLKILAHYMGNYQPIKAMLFLKEIIVVLFKISKVTSE
jgi:hypothetical protein